jgi:iron complex transport system permease protein
VAAHVSSARPTAVADGAQPTAAPRRREGTRRPALTRGGTRALGALLAAAVLVLCAVASVAYGSVELGWGTVIGAFTHFDGSNEHVIVREIRVPRTLIGIAVGMALALAGTIMQGVTRNPLADPGILGIEAGASLAVVLAIFWFGIVDVHAYVWFAFVGAAAAAVAVYALGGSGRDGATPVRLALAGTVMAALLGAITSAVLVLDSSSLDQFRFWVVGSLAGRDLDILIDVAPFLGIGIVLALLSGRSLNALSLGEDVARALGQRVGLTRVTMAVSVVLLAGGAVAAAGPIAFVGLAVPQAARILVGTDWRWVLCYSALLGPILLLSADIVGRIVVRPAELQVGIVTALVGAPIFVALARRRRLAAL